MSADAIQAISALNRARNIVVIGASTGGPGALPLMLTGLPKLWASILVVQHMPEFINEQLRLSLASRTDMDVEMARDGDQIRHGAIYVTPGDYHLELVNNRTIRLSRAEKVNFVRPSVDVTMKSLIRRVGDQLIGVIMTGMGRDGAEGIAHMKRTLKAVTIAQDQASCIVFGMPKEAIATGCVDHVLTPEQMRVKLVQLVGPMPRQGSPGRPATT